MYSTYVHTVYGVNGVTETGTVAVVGCIYYIIDTELQYIHKLSLFRLCLNHFRAQALKIDDANSDIVMTEQGNC